MKTAFVGILLGTATLLSSLAGEVVAKTGKSHDREVTILENGFVRLSVTPGIGGRVLEFVNLKTGHGMAKVRLDNIAKKPDDNWTGADYGGFTDVPVLGVGWPGDFWGLTYELKVVDGKDGAKAVVANAKAGQIGIERTMTLFPDSTMLRIETRQTNIGNAPQKMRVRFHCEMAVGERADDNDDVFYASPDGVKVMDYVVGAEYARMEILKVAGGWLALSDTVEKESVVKLLRADGVQDVFYWAGANEATQIVGNEGAFVGLDWLGKEQLVQPGQSFSSTEDMFLSEGIGKPDFVDTLDAIVGEVTTDRKVYGKSGSVVVTSSLAAAKQLAPATVKITVGHADKELASLEGKIPGAAPGTASSAGIKWDYSDLEDGPYRIRAVFVDGNAGEIGRAEGAFEINRALLDKLMALLSEEKKALDGLKAQIKQKGAGKSLDVSTELSVLEFRMEGIESLLKSGSYDKMNKELAVFKREAEWMNSLLGNSKRP